MSQIRKYNKQQQDQVECLVKAHATLVKRIAHHLRGRIPDTVPIEDLIQAGMMGLLEAARKFKEDKGASFETYAGIRIRGSILDEARKNDWVPRSVYRNARRISESIQALEASLNRDVKDHEVAEHMGVSLDEYHQILRDTNVGRILGFEELGIPIDLAANEDSNAPSPGERVAQEDLQAKIAAMIDKLPDREKLVLSLYYDEELNLKEIGEVIGVSESRISQIHGQAMLRLRARIQADFLH